MGVQESGPETRLLPERLPVCAFLYGRFQALDGRVKLAALGGDHSDQEMVDLKILAENNGLKSVVVV